MKYPVVAHYYNGGLVSLLNVEADRFEEAIEIAKLSVDENWVRIQVPVNYERESFKTTTKQDNEQPKKPSRFQCLKKLTMNLLLH